VSPAGPAELGVFGGSGLYALLDDAHTVAVETPYGPPSGDVHLGTLAGRSVAFLPRHGPAHELPPHRINYRANLWAMRELGVTRLFGPCASGSLQPGIHPGEFVVGDQLVDRTWGRPDTYYDGPDANHVGFADPYCPELRAVAVRAGRAEGITVHDGGTVVVVQGPRFSTRAESRWYRSAGWEVINMTQYPEAVLARELGICYASIALITDYDTGVEGVDVEAVSQAEVFAFFEANVDRVRALLHRALVEVPAERGCDCAAGDNGVAITPPQ
jgi:5'-methylthioadenosine phosphorylase